MFFVGPSLISTFNESQRYTHDMSKKGVSVGNEACHF